MSGTSCPKSTIGKLPVEILQHVISFIPSTTRVRFKDCENQLHNLPQILIIRSVSRFFREIVDQAADWLHDDFDFAYLVYRHRIYRERISLLTRELVKDASLVEHLSRKTGWLFSDFNSLLIVIRTVPRFFDSTLRVNLHRVCCSSSFSSRTTQALQELKMCHSLQTLQIDYNQGEVADLAEIAEYSPRIKELVLKNVWKVMPTSFRGSGLSHVERLSITAGSPSMHRTKWGLISVSTILPRESTRSLTTLSLESYFGEWVEADALNDFANLASLYLYPLTKAMCRVLIASNFRQLREFRVDIDLNSQPFLVLEPQWMAVSRILHSDGFSQLEILTVTHSKGFSANRPYIWSTAAKFLSTLPSQLRFINLQMCLNSDWFEDYFTCLPLLQKLHWIIPRCFRGQLLVSNPDGDAFDGILSVFREAFIDSASKPTLELSIAEPCAGGSVITKYVGNSG